MTPLLSFLVVFWIGETAAYLVFRLIIYILQGNLTWTPDRQCLKGILERLFVFLCLVMAIPQGVIAFAALKVGSRFTKDAREITADYFFIGNIVSLLFAVGYYLIWKQ
ncbi:MAG TPA: hypothetical protein ENN40_03730 [Candidatus Aminicenantes bacterium]|nr:hypothetical protein [Candidatus Aminicenantes bacterium]